MRCFWSGGRLKCNWWLLRIRKCSSGLAFPEIFETCGNMDDRLRRVFLRIGSRVSRQLCDNLLRFALFNFNQQGKHASAAPEMNVHFPRFADC